MEESFGSLNLWKTDGTTAGTSVAGTVPGDDLNDQLSTDGFILQQDDKLYFNAYHVISRDEGEDIYNSFYVFKESILPVTLLEFNAVLKGKVVELTWATTTETNSKYFSLERSIDGSRFESIGRVDAAGNSSIKRNYLFTDTRALQTGMGILYYRIQMVDADGRFKYSRVISLPLNRLVDMSPFAQSCKKISSRLHSIIQSLQK